MLPCVFPPLWCVCVSLAQVEFTYPSHVSEGARDLINRLLKHNPMHRLPIQGVLTHHWVVENSTKKPSAFVRSAKESQWAHPLPLTQTMESRCWETAVVIEPGCLSVLVCTSLCPSPISIILSLFFSHLRVNIYLFRIMKMYLLLLEAINLFLSVECVAYSKADLWRFYKIQRVILAPHPPTQKVKLCNWTCSPSEISSVCSIFRKVQYVSVMSSGDVLSLGRSVGFVSLLCFETFHVTTI